MTAIPCSEAQAQKAVRQLFELYGWEVLRMEEDWHNPDGRGTPDLLCTSPHGLQLWLELKRPASSRNPRGRVRKAQRERLAEWRRRGVACCVVDGVNWVVEDLARYADMKGAGIWVLTHCDNLCAEYDWWPK